jgi:hypothetical protein
MNKVLADGGKLLVERTIQLLDDLRTTFHKHTPLFAGCCHKDAGYATKKFEKFAASSLIVEFLTAAP